MTPLRGAPEGVPEDVQTLMQAPVHKSPLEGVQETAQVLIQETAQALIQEEELTRLEAELAQTRQPMPSVETGGAWRAHHAVGAV